MPVLQHNIGLHNHAAIRIGLTNDAALGNHRVGQQAALNLRSCYVIARRNDHVIGARLIPKVALRIAHVAVTCDIPPVFNIVSLAFIIEVATPRWTAHGKPPHRSISNGFAVPINHHRFVPRHRNTRAAGADVAFRRGYENMQHFCCADAIQKLKPGCLFPCLERGPWQRLAR